MMEFNVPRKDIEELMSKEREEIKKDGCLSSDKLLLCMVNIWWIKKDPEGIKTSSRIFRYS